eukprot:1175730-Prorocentrum_minimum.AAC.1
MGPVMATIIMSLSVACALYARSAKAVFIKDIDASAKMSKLVTETFGAVRTVRSFQGESKEIERFQSVVARTLVTGREIGNAKSNLEVCAFVCIKTNGPSGASVTCTSCKATQPRTQPRKQDRALTSTSHVCSLLFTFVCVFTPAGDQSCIDIRVAVRAVCRSVCLNIHTGALNIHAGALNIHTVALNIHTVALNIHTVALNIHTGALNIHTVALNIHTVALNIHERAHARTLSTSSRRGFVARDVKGNGVDVKGNGVDVKGNGVDVKGNSVDVKGNGVDVKGNL